MDMETRRFLLEDTEDWIFYRPVLRVSHLIAQGNIIFRRCPNLQYFKQELPWGPPTNHPASNAYLPSQPHTTQAANGFPAIQSPAVHIL